MTRWHNANKKKPYPGEKVLIYPPQTLTAEWCDKKQIWISGDYPLPAYPYALSNVQKWAYIDYPRKSFERAMCSRKWNPWWKLIWKKIINK
jgi:hypothetical protein